jgi:hypothetical protein
MFGAKAKTHKLKHLRLSVCIFRDNGYVSNSKSPRKEGNKVRIVSEIRDVNFGHTKSKPARDQASEMNVAVSRERGVGLTTANFSAYMVRCKVRHRPKTIG